MKDKRIAITGIGIVSTLGNSKEEYWEGERNDIINYMNLRTRLLKNSTFKNEKKIRIKILTTYHGMRENSSSISSIGNLEIIEDVGVIICLDNSLFSSNSLSIFSSIVPVATNL